MFSRPSLVIRIAVGKMAGLAFGLAAFFTIPALAPGTPEMFRWGVMLWYLSLGAFIGVAGVISRHPVLKMEMSWWMIGGGIGAWMNFVLVLLAHDPALAVMSEAFGAGSALANPFWLVVEGLVVGLVIGWLTHRFGGEGRAAMDM